MFSFFQGSRKGKGRDKSQDQSRSPFARSASTSRHRVVGQSIDDNDADDYDEEDELLPAQQPRNNASYFDQIHERDFGDYDNQQEEEDEEDEDAVDTPLLPIFSAAHLDRLPLYNTTHAIRLLIMQKCETTLSWDQLRSPQVSQFLVKPVESQVRANHFNRATLCALIANCLQFQKECQLRPGTSGVSKTRALTSELLAMRLLKEFSTRELIDALSYDFDPLQGMSASNTGTATPMLQDVQGQKAQARAARVSTIEIAIRAQAKRFLAHPLVVQHLEAIWAGTVVFHSEADNLHRKPQRLQDVQRGRRANGYGTIDDRSPSALPADSVFSRKAPNAPATRKAGPHPPGRRAVTLYDPRDASLFKLSRLRVPRYRQVLNTLSLAVMLGLFLAVLAERSLYITPLEVVFWIWSAGYMLDEVVGFTEQGFGLYILSFWNAFDLGILLLFGIYYCLRLYGIVLAGQGKHRIADMAYDVLASTSILLFPRLFGVLDHYRYFSQLLIAFRMMAQDLVAILVLIVIFCSGFFVAFTLSFSNETQDANGVAYALFQILMGFSPAAWDQWPAFNLLGKAVMVIFLIICHFLIVTILITVLTNSFMAIVKNAEEEHQFLFAVNTISMVKSDALFSYVAPANVIGWALSPLRFVMPFREYVRFNRTIIKMTHFPILFVIFAYERVVLAMLAYEPTDLVEKPAVSQAKPVAFSINKAQDVFSPGRRLREPSVVSFNKDRALDEVFRRPYRGSTVRTTTHDMDGGRRNSSDAVDKWMQVAENEGGASPPMEQPRSVLDRLETRKPKIRRSGTAERAPLQPSQQFSTASMSIASDPDRKPFSTSRRPPRIDEESELTDEDDPVPQETDADGDDENNDDSEPATTPAPGESALSVADRRARAAADESGDEYFHTPMADKSPYQLRRARAEHGRNVSSGTILFAPQETESSSSQPLRTSKPSTVRNSENTPAPPPQRSQHLTPGQQPPAPKPKPIPATKPRPAMPARQKTAPSGYAGLSFMQPRPPHPSGRLPSFNARALDLASEIGDNKFGPSGLDAVAGGISGFPASFSEHFLREREIERRREEERRRSEEEEKGMVNRIMLARMHTLEEGFREVLREIKDLSSQKATGSSGSRGGGGGGGGSEGEVMGGAGTGLGYPSAVSSSSNLVKSHARPSLQQGMQSTSTSRISDVLEPRTPVRSTRLGAGAATTTKDGSNPKTTKKSPRKHHHLQQTRRAAAPPSAETSTTTTTTTATLAAGKGKQPAQEAEEEEDHPAPTNPNPSYDPTEENEIPSPESVIGPSVLEDARDGAAAAAERPGTAIHSPAAFDGGRRVGEE
ncbi:hypothetical protein KC332_g4290 [Hortaea werneckii]|uniref:Uncharacterized protein n=2 Tax=Hortaea werneckii TaxID=91943 RepID=A0A3M7IYZ4_HORWE|nr:hypothetical protein KC329_g4587 [Hortaea werneckii]KAI7414152.1 hypothetical protein KC332_g4290 [Hortaea werneckii]KAI7434611.1 hypothetical protein KC368_g14383 [Hortaea werneckii]KAI7440755.1 hypothetical protein KC336_g2386 [Hortaea werneckii]RMZ30700.1 hypothetical protein D0859_05206 [Hortaea werneckii]